jgi:hypothetical protein
MVYGRGTRSYDRSPEARRNKQAQAENTAKYLVPTENSVLLSQLNLGADGHSLQPTCSRSFSRCFLPYGEAFGVEPFSMLRSLPFGINY